KCSRDGRLDVDEPGWSGNRLVQLGPSQGVCSELCGCNRYSPQLPWPSSTKSATHAVASPASNTSSLRNQRPIELQITSVDRRFCQSRQQKHSKCNQQIVYATRKSSRS